jgi:DNA-binding GntR family transcriptional regulator
MSGITDLRQYASETTLHVGVQKIVEIDVKTAERLGASVGETWLYIQGLRSIAQQSQPISFTEVYVAPRFRSIQGIVGQLTLPIYQMIEEQFDCKIKTVQQEIQAMVMTSAIAKKLDAPAKSACLWICRRYLDERDELVEIAMSVHPSDRFSYRESFRREWQI